MFSRGSHFAGQSPPVGAGRPLAASHGEFAASSDIDPGLALITRNLRAFQHAGLTLLDLWTVGGAARGALTCPVVVMTTGARASWDVELASLPFSHVRDVGAGLRYGCAIWTAAGHR